uniref:2Fe-2S ferredoxin n=1 Tax=OCS116 cluster bacterium TaxID=2030921 RepID=A0A2A4Z7Q4_9PROT
MVAIKFILSNATEIDAILDEGDTVMEGAVKNNIEGIVAECGGACSCATCHAYIDEAWLNTVGLAVDDEADMLEFAEDTRPTSRLTCQIKVTENLNGLIVYVPKSQA